MKKYIYTLLLPVLFALLILGILAFIVMVLYGPRTASAATLTFSTDLSYGKQNSIEVKALQAFLAQEGVFKGEATGNFFGLTQEAVRKWQAKNSLPRTGFFGPLSRGVANARTKPQPQPHSEQASTTAPIQPAAQPPVQNPVGGTHTQPVLETTGNPPVVPGPSPVVQSQVETVVQQTVVSEVSSTQSATSTQGIGVVNVLKVPTCKLVGTPSGANGGGYLAIFGWTMDAKATGSIDHGVGALDAYSSRYSNKVTSAPQTDAVVTYTLTETMTDPAYKPTTTCTVDVDISRLMNQ